MSTKTTRATRAASLVSGTEPLTEAQGKALASEYRAQDKAEGAASLKRARVAYVLFQRKTKGQPYGTNGEIGDLLGISGQRAQQMAQEVAYVVGAGFDLSLNDVSAEAVAAHRTAMTLRKIPAPAAANKAEAERKAAETVADVLAVAAAATTDAERAAALDKATTEAVDKSKAERKSRAGVPGKSTAAETEANKAEAPNPGAALKSHLRSALAVLTGDYAGTLSPALLDDVAGLLADLDNALSSQMAERESVAA